MASPVKRQLNVASQFTSKREHRYRGMACQSFPLHRHRLEVLTIKVSFTFRIYIKCDTVFWMS